MECKTHMRTQSRALPCFIITFLFSLLGDTSLAHTFRFVPRGADEQNLMLDQCLVQEADLAV